MKTQEWSKESFLSILPAERVRVDEPMAAHTSFRVGGPADFFLMPSSVDELSVMLHRCCELEMPYTIIGNGTNLLVSDRGVTGAVIQIGEGLSKTKVEGESITAGAGILLSQLAQLALHEKLAGLAFAAGIPGSLGGACVMNAGAYGFEMKDVLESILVLARDAVLEMKTPEELGLDYRFSLIPQRGDIVLAARLKLEEGDPEEISKEMADLAERRREKQPLEFASAGSTFKRPEGQFAGKLIQESGMAGRSVGGARVSEKHCGFIVNTGGATAMDIYLLMQLVKAEVERTSGISLQPEVKILGQF